MRSVTPMPQNTLLNTVADSGIVTLPNTTDDKTGTIVFFGTKMVAQPIISANKTIKPSKEELKILIKTNLKRKNIKQKYNNDCAITIKSLTLPQSNKNQVNAKLKATSGSALKKTDSLPPNFTIQNSMDATSMACIHSPSGNHYA